MIKGTCKSEGKETNSLGIGYGNSEVPFLFKYSNKNYKGAQLKNSPGQIHHVGSLRQTPYLI